MHLKWYEINFIKNENFFDLHENVFKSSTSSLILNKAQNQLVNLILTLNFFS